MQENTARQLHPESKVRIEDNSIRVELESGLVTLPSESLPVRYVEWIEQGRRAMYDKLMGKGNPAFFTSHLPVMITQSLDQAFPFNCGNKGVGYLPKPEYLQEFIDLFHATIENTRGRPWQESLRERIEAVSRFYFDREKIDYRAMSSLEIFEKTTFKNLSRTPLAALHYTGNAPDYMSFQINAAVEVIGPDDPRHEFIKLARVMFEYDSFHIAQHQFPYAYIFWISSVQDKTPFRVPEKAGKVITLASKGEMKWNPDAIESINRAPGMIRQFITEQIEKYAKDRGFKEITMDLMKEAREVLERPPKEDGISKTEKELTPPIENWKYSHIYVALDSSEPSNEAMALAMEIGKREGAEMIGSHVYAAKMHDNRFRAMEGGLPEEFQKEKELNRQRKIHDSLITKGLELITDSYLEAMAEACKGESLPFTAVSLEGKNWKAMVEDIHAHEYDLVALGAHGIGRVGNSQLGTVAERMMRRVRRDMLLCKVNASENLSDTIVVCLDGSTRSWGGLQRAMRIAKNFDKKVLAVSAFDPYFHYAMFKSLNKTLTEKARKVFKFEEQEKLHEDIIDSGLAKIYQSYLNIAQRLAGEAGIRIEIRLLDGKPFEKILQLVKQSPPWLLVVGRIGFHSDEDMDIGGNTENLCRLANCNILVVDSQAKPPVEFQAEETVSWTTEAKSRMERVPAMAQNMAMKAIQNYCIAEGHTVVTESILNAALKTLLPPQALAKMGIVTEENSKEGDALDKIALSFKCQACGHVHHGSRPQSCPICGMGGHMFKLLESAVVEDGQALETLGNRQLIWEKPALALLESIQDPVLKNQIRNRLEKQTLTQRIAAVTLAMVESEITPSEVSKPMWTESAIERLNRVPEGFMRQAAKNMVEEHATTSGQKEITLDVVETGLGKAREKMHATMTGQGPHHQSGPNPHAVQNTESAPWECHLCGLIVDGSKPTKCPNCNTGHFMQISIEQRSKAHPAAFKILDWNSEAKARLERVPIGFMRDMTRSRVEKWARAAGLDYVGIEVMDGKYGSWGDGSAKVKLDLDWSEDALIRTQKIPDFIRSMVMKEIERRSKGLGKDKVIAEDIDQAMQHWSGSGSFHGHG